MADALSDEAKITIASAMNGLPDDVLAYVMAYTPVIYWCTVPCVSLWQCCSFLDNGVALPRALRCCDACRCQTPCRWLTLHNLRTRASRQLRLHRGNVFRVDVVSRGDCFAKSSKAPRATGFTCCFRFTTCPRCERCTPPGFPSPFNGDFVTSHVCLPLSDR